MTHLCILIFVYVLQGIERSSKSFSRVSHGTPPPGRCNALPAHYPPPRDLLEDVVQEIKTESFLHVPIHGALVCQAEYGRLAVEAAPSLEMDAVHHADAITESKEMIKRLRIQPEMYAVGACLVTPAEGVTEQEHTSIASRRSSFSLNVLVQQKFGDQENSASRLERWGRIVHGMRRKRREEAFQKMRNLFSLLSIDGDI
jgi:hypothetical protein